MSKPTVYVLVTGEHVLATLEEQEGKAFWDTPLVIEMHPVQTERGVMVQMGFRPYMIAGEQSEKRCNAPDEQHIITAYYPSREVLAGYEKKRMEMISRASGIILPTGAKIVPPGNTN